MDVVSVEVVFVLSLGRKDCRPSGHAPPGDQEGGAGKAKTQMNPISVLPY